MGKEHDATHDVVLVAEAIQHLEDNGMPMRAKAVRDLLDTVGDLAGELGKHEERILSETRQTARSDETPRTDALVRSKPGMWRDWKDEDFHALEQFTKELEREANREAYWADQHEAEKNRLLAVSATRLIQYQRVPNLDKRISLGDDFAGDAWVRWVVVGHTPEDAAPQVAEAVRPGTVTLAGHGRGPADAAPDASAGPAGSVSHADDKGSGM